MQTDWGGMGMSTPLFNFGEAVVRKGVEWLNQKRKQAVPFWVESTITIIERQPKSPSVTANNPNGCAIGPVSHDALRSEDIADVVVFVLSQPAHVPIRDLVILPLNQDI